MTPIQNNKRKTMKINRKYILIRLITWPLKLSFTLLWCVVYGFMISFKWLITGSQELFVSHSKIADLVKQNEKIIELLKNKK